MFILAYLTAECETSMHESLFNQHVHHTEALVVHPAVVKYRCWLNVKYRCWLNAYMTVLPKCLYAFPEHPIAPEVLPVLYLYREEVDHSLGLVSTCVCIQQIGMYNISVYVQYFYTWMCMRVMNVSVFSLVCCLGVL